MWEIGRSHVGLYLSRVERSVKTSILYQVGVPSFFDSSYWFYRLGGRYGSTNVPSLF